MDYFPVVYPNEYFYSVLLRYDRHTDNNMVKTMKEVFGDSNRLSNNISKIKYFNKQFDNSYNPIFESLLVNNTNLELLLPFTGKSLSVYDADYIYKYIYPSSYRVLPSGYLVELEDLPVLKYCKECVDEDEKSFGESYFHQKHQCLGSYVCTKHAILLSYCIPSRKDGSFYVYAINRNDDITLSNISDTLLSKLTNLSIDIEKFSLNIVKARQVITKLKSYKRILISQGYGCKKDKKLSYQNIIDDLKTLYGEEFLRFTSVYRDEDRQNNYLKRIIKSDIQADNNIIEPFHHIIFIRFLSEVIKHNSIGRYANDLFSLIE